MAADIDNPVLIKLAGVAGSALSLFFVKGSWHERVAMSVGGAAVSYYAAPWIAGKTGLPDGLCGFFVGLFGMAVVAKAYELIQQAPIAELWGKLVDALGKRLGG